MSSSSGQGPAWSVLSLGGCGDCVTPAVKAGIPVAMWETSLQLQAGAVAGVLLSGFTLLDAVVYLCSGYLCKQLLHPCS